MPFSKSHVVQWTRLEVEAGYRESGSTQSLSIVTKTIALYLPTRKSYYGTQFAPHPRKLSLFYNSSSVGVRKNRESLNVAATQIERCGIQWPRTERTLPMLERFRPIAARGMVNTSIAFD
eukprot:4141793-Amphidinium_carterae.1